MNYEDNPVFMRLNILHAFIVVSQPVLTMALHHEDNGKPHESAGRKATGLTPVLSGYGGRVTI